MWTQSKSPYPALGNRLPRDEEISVKYVMLLINLCEPWYGLTLPQSPFGHHFIILPQCMASGA